MNWNLSVTYPFLSPRIRVRERLSRDETAQRPPDCSPDRNQANRQRSAQHTTQHPQTTQQKTFHKPQHNPRNHPTHSQTASDPEYQHYGPAVNSQSYVDVPIPVSNAKLLGPPEVQPRRRMSADQMYAAHREARSEARQALKEEAHTEGLLKSRKAVLPSEIRRREKSVDDIHRGQHEDMDWQNCSPEGRRKSQEEEDYDPKRLRERGRERNVERIRERGREPVSSYDNQDDRVIRSMQPNHTSVHHQARQNHPSETDHHEESHIQEHEPPNKQQRQHGAQNQQQDSKRQYQHEHSRQPQDSQRPRLSHNQQEYELQRQDLSHQQDLQGKQRESQLEEVFEPQRQQQDSSGHKRFDSAVHLQTGSSLPQVKHRSIETSGGPKPKTRTRSMSDIGLSKHSALYHMDRASASRDTTRAIPSSVMANGEMGALDTRVSVAQLRHSYLENANRKPEM